MQDPTPPEGENGSGAPGRPARRGIFILPSLLTTGGLFAGFYAIVMATKANFEAAAIAIFIAMVMDGLDGRVARLTNTTSDFGSEYDSLVDMVCFGLSPALVLYEWTLSGLGRLGWLVAFVYVAAVGLRLARFNSQRLADKRHFHGLPCPAAAATLAGLVWALTDHDFSGRAVAIGSLVLTLLLAVAMVSNVRYRSFKDLDLKGRIPFVATLVIVFFYVLVVFDPPRVLFLICLLYFLSGPVLWLHRRWRRAPARGA